VTSVAILRGQASDRDREHERSERLLREADRVNADARALAARLQRIAELYRERLVNRRP
jgi:hypothetical protein